MPKFPDSPGAAVLARLEPAIVELRAGTRLARVYYSRSRHPLAWNAFRHFGPLNARWDHHLVDASGAPHLQARGIYHAARDARTCFAEFFQATRRIDRAFQAPWLVIVELACDLELLDLTGAFATRMGASMAIHSRSRVRARGWARELYSAFPRIQGIQFAASMNAGAPAVVLNERAESKGPFAAHPLFHRALADDVLLDPLKHAAAELGFALR